MWQLALEETKRYAFALPPGKMLVQVISSGNDYVATLADISLEESSSPAYYVQTEHYVLGPFVNVDLLEFSPDNSTLVCIGRKEYSTEVWLGKVRIGEFDAVDRHLFWQGNNFVFIVRKKGKFQIYSGTRKLGSFDAVGQIAALGQDSLVVSAKKKKKTTGVYRDGELLGEFNKISELFSLLFQEDVFFTGQKLNGWYYYLGGELQGPFSEVQIVDEYFSASGNVCLHILTPAGYYVKSSEWEWGPWEQILQVAASQDGQIAVAGTAAGSDWIRTREGTLGPFERVAHLEFIADSRGKYNLFCVTKTGHNYYATIGQFSLTTDILLKKCWYFDGGAIFLSGEYQAGCHLLSCYASFGLWEEVYSVVQLPTGNILVNGRVDGLDHHCIAGLATQEDAFARQGRAFFDSLSGVYVAVLREGNITISLNGKTIGEFDSYRVFVSPKGRVVFYAGKQEQFYIVYDRKVYGPYIDVEEPIFSPNDTLAAKIVRDDGVYIFLQYKQYGPFRQVSQYSWNPLGEQIIIVGATQDGWHIFEGDSMLGPFNGVGRLNFSPLTGGFHCSVTDKGNIKICSGSELIGNFGNIWEWNFSEDCSTYVLKTYNEQLGTDITYIIVNGKEYVGSPISVEQGGGYIYYCPQAQSLIIKKQPHDSFEPEFDELFEPLVEQFQPRLTSSQRSRKNR